MSTPGEQIELKLESDNLLTLVELTNTATGDIVNGANVAVTLYESDGATEVSGETWPLAMAEIGSTGSYRCTLTDSLVLDIGDRYLAKIVADAGAGLKRTFWRTVVARR